MTPRILKRVPSKQMHPAVELPAEALLPGTRVRDVKVTPGKTALALTAVR